MILQGHELHLQLGKTQVLRGLDIAIEPATVTAVLGPNGSGKSTLLKAFAGQYHLDRGQVRWHDRDITSTGVPARLREGIALVPQGKRLFPGMTVEENLVVGAFARRLDRATLRAELESWYAEFPVVATLRGRRAGVLSGGEQQLVALLRGLMSKPTLLMLDEPSIGVSPKALNDIAAIISTLVEHHRMTIVLVEQNVGFALDVASEVAVLKAGRLASKEPADRFQDRSSLADIYFGPDTGSDSPRVDIHTEK